MKDSQIINNCLLCNGNVEEIISFGDTPLANELMTDQDFSNPNSEKHQKFDLTLMHCVECGHCQLKTVVNEDRLYKHYLYVSGTNASNVEHFKKYAENIMDRFYPNRFKRMLVGDNNDLIIEIASNDGTFLKWFDSKIKKIGVDPAENLVAEAAKNGVTNIPVFFNEETAKNEIAKACDGKKAKAIVANNMFAHNKDLTTIVKGVKELLSEGGSFVFENSYLLDILDHSLFDLVYHEHVHHHSITPLVKFFDKLDMKVYDVERLPNHGGSIRVFVCRKSNSLKVQQSVNDLLELERSIPTKLKLFKENIDLLKNKIVSKIDELIAAGKTVGVLGLPAKATTMLYYFGLNNKINYIFDDNQLKQGLHAPGTNIKILPTSEIYKQNPNILIVLAWNFSESLVKQHKYYAGKFIIPLPEYKEI